MREALLRFGDTAKFRGIGKPFAVRGDLSGIACDSVGFATPKEVKSVGLRRDILSLTQVSLIVKLHYRSTSPSISGRQL
jgi:hypothetical protein